ncbi:hypothetical protein [Angustibacter sp. Root456]|uniref:hypothetical protein n=1 Tax=Angustibacter sp. Root456 TaxID=1736539 RepID=UPI0006FE599C|nr:hypothetical protein [Angustibacter sp. Root456]KQX69888.1 hypothetical protein ASD06_02465 [Angustibacter sp. Root456]
MELAIELWDEPELQRCTDCGGRRKFYSGEVLSPDVETVAVFLTYLYEHDGDREVFIDAVFGTWGADAADDHETFGARTGRIEGTEGDVSSLVTGGHQAPDDADVLGVRLTREHAMNHPLLPLFWQVNDLLLREIASQPQSWTGVRGGSGRTRRRRLRRGK